MKYTGLKSACLCAQLLSYVQLFVTPWTIAHQATLSMKFSRQEYWNGLPFLSSGDLPKQGIESISLLFPALAGGLFTTVPPEICTTYIVFDIFTTNIYTA